MGGPYHEPPYPALSASDFGSAKQYQVVLQNGARTVAIGDITDLAIQTAHTCLSPGTDAIDVVIHGLPGRFIEQLGGRLEIPVFVVADLLESVGIQRGTPLRLLTCHAAELPMFGNTTAQELAKEWGGAV